MNKWLVITVLVIAAIFFYTLARADYPNGFDKIHQLCEASENVVDEVKVIEVYMPDTINPGNPDGKILLLAGEGPKGIGVGMVILTSEDDPIVGVIIYHFNDETTVVRNVLTGEIDDIGETTVQLFIDEWFRLYNLAIGTQV
jgi:hypothetical protein